ncbi:hypothetical protein H5J24_09685 [Chryseobacterium capnotolerans]|uniref:hypothetical protein n=1 Tax=Chryseobacterium capnotolerans TaxID=2759528 RepID=UPI001E3C9D9C|nr:hypothetical protein [Chryseobacterium capnotolerans]UHO40899.1 hypothetical protein H5J24_09685 [Chryseobacterium capnotolerans]
MNQKTAYFFLRLSMGINFLGHGLVRLAKLQDFADGMTKSFEKSWLPSLFVQMFSTALPFWNLLLGLCLSLVSKQELQRWQVLH